MLESLPIMSLNVIAFSLSALFSIFSKVSLNFVRFHIGEFPLLPPIIGLWLPLFFKRIVDLGTLAIQFYHGLLACILFLTNWS